MSAPPDSDSETIRRPQPGELWSLWDMQKFDTSAFFQVTGALYSIPIIVDRMATPPPDDDVEKTSPMSAALKTKTRGYLSDLIAYAEDLGAQVTTIAIRELRVSCKPSSTITYLQMAERLKEIESTLRRELKLIHLYVVASKGAELLDPEEALFGEDVESSYPSAAFEIEEAGKCLGLGRDTAAVFHLMRVMEIGLRTVAKCLAIPDPIKEAERNWGVVLRKIKDELDERGKPKSPRAWKTLEDKALFGDLYASLDAVKVAWRNSTMHVEGKYTFDEAEHIFVATRGFMKKLALRCDESGAPLA